MALVELVSVAPLGWVVRHEPANGPPRRRFAAVRVAGAYRWLAGHAVVDEFGTLSSPIFVAPIQHLGKVYDAGLAHALRRGADLDLDAGWPPLVAGIDRAAEPLPEDWRERFASALAAPFAPAAEEETAAEGAAPPQEDADGRPLHGAADPAGSTGDGGPTAAPPPRGRVVAPVASAAPACAPRLRSTRIGDHLLTAVQIGEVAILATDAPLLPRQLGRLAEAARLPCAIALATGNELLRTEAGSRLALRALSEAGLERLLAVVPDLVTEP